MLTKNDELQMQALMNERPDFRYIIEKLKEEQQYVVSQISHEIRNPVTLINSSLQLIEKQHPDVKDFAFWDQTMEDMKFLRVLLDELSTYNNGERLQHAHIPIKDFLNTIASSIKSYLDSKDIEFHCILQDELPTIQVDETKLHQALNNLLRNAVEAIDNDGKVLLHAYTKGQTLFISVKDDGCGIAPEHMDTLFTPFVTHKKGGSGLGLSITKRIIEAHNGTLFVDSVPGSGTTFIVSLPF